MVSEVIKSGIGRSVVVGQWEIWKFLGKFLSVV